MRHISTIKLLVEWARWGSAHNIDYPSMSPMFGERALKSPLYGIGHIPEDVGKIEAIVCSLSWNDREILILRYQRRLSFREIGERISRAKSVAQDRLRSAENEVHRKYAENSCQRRPTMLHSVQAQ